MDRTTITVVSNRFPQLSGSMTQLAAETINIGILTLVEAADPITPVDTGALRANKTIVMATPDHLEGEAGWNQEYGPEQNFGTRRGVAAHHFAETGAAAAEEAMDRHLGSWV